MAELRDNKILVVVRCIIRDSDNNVLLLKRKSGDLHNAEKWELPGGKIESDEDIADLIEREINEETNLVVHLVSDTFYCHSQVLTERLTNKYRGYTYICLTGVANYMGGKVRVPDEHSKFEWVNIKSVFDYDLTTETKKALSSHTKVLKNTSIIREMEDIKLPIWLVARALVKNKENKYLLLRRAKKESYLEEWEIPGGKLRSLEVLHESLKREVFEEAGIIIEIENLPLHISSFVSPEGTYKGWTYINIIHSAKVIAGKIVISSEHDKYGWFSKEDIFKLNLTPYIRMQLTDVLLKMPI